MSFPGGGETVGEAYIRILADGSGLDRDIRREWKQHEPEFDHAGRDSHAAYRKGFDDEYKKRPLWASAVKSMREGHGRFAAVGKFLGDDAAKNIRRSLEDQLGNKDLARRIFKNLSEEARRTGNLGVFKKGLGDNLAAEIDKALRQIQALNKKAAGDDERAKKDRLKRAEVLNRALQGLEIQRYNAISRVSSTLAHRDREEFRKLYESLARDAKNGSKSAVRELEKLHIATRDLVRDGNNGLLRMDGRLRQGTRSATDFERTMRRMDDRIKKIDFGRMFGKGSRNNFFNAIGSLVGGIASLTARAGPRLVGTLARISGEFSNANRSSRGFFGTLRALGEVALTNLASIGPMVIKSALGLGAAFLAMFVVAAPLAAAISSLTAGLVALAGTISFALVGALGALFPLIAPLIALVITLGVAFAGMGVKARKALSEQVKPITKFFKDLRETIRKNLFSELGKDAKIIGPVLDKQLVPLFGRVAKAIARVGTTFSKMIASPSFVTFLKAMQTFIPHAIESLGRSFSRLFSGFAGLIRALVPFTNRLLAKFEQLTGRFDKFANSAKGQNKIAKFMDKAWESAGKLWHTLRSLFHVFVDLASAGRKPGNGLLDSINSSLDRFDRFLKSDKGKRALAGWFSDMKKFFSALGAFISGIGKLFSALDSPEGHRILEGLLRGLGKIAEFIAKAIPPMLDLAKKIIPPVVAAFKTLFGVVRPFIEFLGDHPTFAKYFILGILGMTLALKGLLAVAKVNLLLTPLFAAMGRTAIGGGIAAWGSRIGASIAASAAGIQGKVRILGSALAGLTIAMAGSQLGKSLGGTGGKVVSTASWVGGGALAGSAFGPWGTAIGSLIGGVIALGTVWGDSGDAAEEASKRATAAALVQKQAVLDLADAIKGAGGDAFQPIKDTAVKGLSTPLSKVVPDNTVTKSAFQIADQAHIPLKDLTAAALAGQDALFKMVTALDKFGATSPKAAFEASLVKKALYLLQTQAAASELEFERQARGSGDLAFAFIPLKNEVKKYGVALDKSSAFGLRNRFVIDQQAAALRKSAFAHVTNGKSALAAAGKMFTAETAFRKAAVAAGFDADTVNDLTAKYFALPKSIVTKLEKIGVTPDQIQQITTKYGKIPKKWLTAVTKTGVTPAQIQAITDKYLHVPTKRTTEVVLVDGTYGPIKRILARIDQIHGKTVYIDAVVRQSGGTIILPGTGKKLAAAGGILNHATLVRPDVIGGEAGREALVPLDRPLSMISPSVRAIAAFAQGLENGKQTKLASGGVVAGGGKTINVESGAFTIVTPTTDPEAVAAEVFNRIAAGGYS